MLCAATRSKSAWQARRAPREERRRSREDDFDARGEGGRFGGPDPGLKPWGVFLRPFHGQEVAPAL